MLPEAPETIQHMVNELWSVRNSVGTEAVVDYLRGNDDALSDQQRHRVSEVRETLGTDRIEQILGTDYEPSVTVYHIPTHPEADRTDVLNALHERWEAGEIALYRTQQVMPALERGIDENLYHQCNQWVLGRSIELPPAFDFDSPEPTFPDVFAVATVEGTIRSVYPHSHESGYCALTAVTEFVSTGGHIDCQVRQSEGATRSADSGQHGHIKDVLHEELAGHLSNEWTDPIQEDPVGTREDAGQGAIDIRFRHQDEHRHLLVEVKTDPDRVDKAFGQLYRYKHRFLRDHPGVEQEDIELAIAAPEFWPAHEDSATELDIRLLTVRNY